MSLLKILCIDDDPHVHQLLNEAFREKGHSYSYSLTGAQGLSMVQRERFDIVVIDLILPDILGWEICRTIRGNPDNSGLILVIFTAYLRDVDKFKQFASDLNIDLILRKPFEPTEFVEMLSSFLIGTKKHDESDELSETMNELRGEYLDDFPKKLTEIKKTLERILETNGDMVVVKELMTKAHKIHGNAGIYGLNDFSEIAGKWENFIEEFIRHNAMGKQIGRADEFIDLSADYLLSLERNYHKYTAGDSAKVEPQPLIRLGGNAAEIKSTSSFDMSHHQKEAPDVGKILLVEDDPAVQRMISYALKTRRHSYEIIGDGDDARKRIMEPGERGLPDLLVLDINLPGTDGFTLLREFNEAGILFKMNTLVLTSHGREDDMIKAFSAGAVDYVTKPFSIPVLMFRIQRALKNRPPKEY